MRLAQGPLMNVWHNGGSKNSVVVEDHGDCMVVRSRFYPPQLLKSRRNDYDGEELSTNQGTILPNDNTILCTTGSEEIE